MCLIAFAYNHHPEYKLIFAANRDEFYGRPTRGARFWDEYPGVLAGKDLEAGGTWMGINRKGAFAAVTNYRDPQLRKEDAPSRGHLVLDYLVTPDPPENYLVKVDRKARFYNGFNLLAGSAEKLMYYSNKQQQITDLGPGVYGLSNHLLDTPWPKVQRAKDHLTGIIGNGSVDEQALLDLLTEDEPAPDAELPDTGLPKELEKAVSPIFIKTEKYGTRCSTVLLIDRAGRVTFSERRYEPGTMKELETNHYEFAIEE